MFKKPYILAILIIIGVLVATLAIILIINPSLIFKVTDAENSEVVSEEVEEYEEYYDPKPLPCKCTKEELSKTYTFDLKDYEGELEISKTNKNVGAIKDRDDALKKAKKLWKEMFKDEIDLEANCGIFVAYDKNNKCWHVYAKELEYEDDAYFDEAPHALIQSDGKVLAAWYGTLWE